MAIQILSIPNAYTVADPKLIILNGSQAIVYTGADIPSDTSIKAYSDEVFIGQYLPHGITDHTAFLSAWLTNAAANGNEIKLPAGKFNIWGNLYIPGKSIAIRGAGIGMFNGLAPFEQGTILSLKVPNINLFNDYSNSGLISHKFKDMMIINESGGTNESAFYSLGSDFSEFENLTISGFKYAFQFQKCLYLRFTKLIIRNCEYGISCWNINKTPPLILNDTGSSGFYNNCIVIEDCQIAYSKIGIEVAGTQITVRNVDVSVYTEIGLVIGGDDFNKSMFHVSALYTEGDTGLPIKITKSSGEIDCLFLGGTNPLGLDIKSSRVRIGAVECYGATTKLINNTDSETYLTSYNGNVTEIFTHAGTGFVRQLSRENPLRNIVSLDFGDFIIIPIGGYTNRVYEIIIYGTNAGVKFLTRLIINGTLLYSDTSLPTLLVATTQINGLSTYDLKLTNTATSTNIFNFEVITKPLFYNISL